MNEKPSAESFLIYHGNCIDILKTLSPNSIDAIVTDPPYGLSFMGKHWDYDVPTVDIWRAALRVLKPGGHLLSFGGTRTYHRMAVNIEDAGFEIRDQIQWLYGSGFPKSHNIKEGEFKGWGTALKPANEPIVVARKPLEKGLTVAENVLKWGTGGLNIDATRIGYSADENIDFSKVQDGNIYGSGEIYGKGEQKKTTPLFKPQGRWPANIILDEVAAEMLDEQHTTTAVGYRKNPSTNKTTWFGAKDGSHVEGERGYRDSGGASRFFYVAKASKRERNAGLEGMPTRILARSGGAQAALARGESYDNGDGSFNRTIGCKNHHPTVKPIKLMEYLIKLVCPPSGTVLDPFMGSGSTGVAAKRLGYKFIGIEMNPEYVAIAEKRLESAHV